MHEWKPIVVHYVWKGTFVSGDERLIFCDSGLVDSFEDVEGAIQSFIDYYHKFTRWCFHRAVSLEVEEIKRICPNCNR